MCKTINQHLGKFEGEACLAEYFYWLAGEGDGEVESRNDGSVETFFTGPFGKENIADYHREHVGEMCDNCQATLATGRNFVLIETVDGNVFVGRATVDLPIAKESGS